MTRKSFVACVGSAAALVVILFVARGTYWLRELWLISIVREPPELDPVQRSEETTEMGTRRAKAIKELGEMRSVCAVPHLIDMWGQPSSWADHLASVKAFAAIGKPAVPSLRAALRDRSWRKRCMAEIALKEMELETGEPSE